MNNINRRSLLGSLLAPIYCWLYPVKVVKYDEHLPVAMFTVQFKDDEAVDGRIAFLEEEVRQCRTYITELQNKNDALVRQNQVLMHEIPFGYNQVQRIYSEDLNDEGLTVITLYEEKY